MKPVLQLLDEFAALDGVVDVSLMVEKGGLKRRATMFIRGGPNLVSCAFGTFEDALADLNKKLLAAKGRGLMLEVPHGNGR